MPDQNLYDFALNLLNNPDAQSAFDAAPQDVLNDAGLGDITPGDIQEILPLVLDSTQAQGIDSLSQGLSLGDGGGFSPVNDLAQSLDSAISGGDVTGAVSGVTENIGNGDLGIGGISDLDGITGDLTGVDGITGGLNGLDGLDDVTAGLTSVGDLTASAGDLTNSLQTGDLGISDVVETGPAAVTDTVGDLNVGQVSELGNIGQVAGDLGTIDVGGVLSGNDVDF
ncbi:IniB N-terminal domain-containing protein [Amycolatopsis sp. 195334CR]|uniref:IniB N-terminal domain-containing protein n=1 Tax=Amycolatopsis sp. 195334CR TaxID=2814588 RepID=UPI001A8F7917|nr:IniB N-terminal domain-containing protein [Amycolatopsis sp. 195334CR]MBN6038516.1 IniB N-terminal domain-containing protein [Amycolatopsis sp. 195334CR]